MPGGGHSQEPRTQRQHIAVRRVTSCPCSFGTFGAETRVVPGPQGCWSPSDKCQSWISNSLGAQALDAPLPPLQGHLLTKAALLLGHSCCNLRQPLPVKVLVGLGWQSQTEVIWASLHRIPTPTDRGANLSPATQ